MADGRRMITNTQGMERLVLAGDYFAPPLADFLARHFAAA